MTANEEIDGESKGLKWQTQAVNTHSIEAAPLQGLIFHQLGFYSSFPINNNALLTKKIKCLIFFHWNLKEINKNSIVIIHVFVVFILLVLLEV